MSLWIVSICHSGFNYSHKNKPQLHIRKLHLRVDKCASACWCIALKDSQAFCRQCGLKRLTGFSREDSAFSFRQSSLWIQLIKCMFSLICFGPLGGLGWESLKETDVKETHLPLLAAEIPAPKQGECQFLWLEELLCLRGNGTYIQSWLEGLSLDTWGALMFANGLKSHFVPVVKHYLKRRSFSLLYLG